MRYWLLRILVLTALLMTNSFASAQAADTAPQVNPMALLDDKHVFAVGDQLQYMVTEDRDQPVILFVDERGNINVPLLGRVRALNKTAKSLAYEIKQLLEVDFYYQATVHISYFQDNNSRGQVFVLGRVRMQGPIDIPRSEVLTVSKAILRAGGFAHDADPTRVSLIRRDASEPENEMRMEINVAEILDTGRMDKDMTLQAGDLVFIAQRGDSSGQFTVTGAVRQPGVVRLPGGAKLTLSQAILQAGGFSEFANQEKVKVVRYSENGERQELVVDVEEILKKGNREKDVYLQADDMVIVPEKWISF